MDEARGRVSEVETAATPVNCNPVLGRLLRWRLKNCVI